MHAARQFIEFRPGRGSVRIIDGALGRVGWPVHGVLQRRGDMIAAELLAGRAFVLEERIKRNRRGPALAVAGDGVGAQPRLWIKARGDHFGFERDGHCRSVNADAQSEQRMNQRQRHIK